MLNFSPWNLLFIVVNLLILLVLMRKFLYQPVLNVIAKRQELLDRQLAEAESSKKEAMELKNQYETYISDTKEEKNKILKEAKLEAREEYDKILADADQKAKQMIEDARRAGELEKQKAMKETDLEITRLVVSAATKLASSTLDKKEDYDIYEEFIKKAGEQSETDNQ